MTSKTELNLFVQDKQLAHPVYRVTPKEDGFVCEVEVAGRTFASQMICARKKTAEDSAAGEALKHLKNSSTDSSQTKTSNSKLANGSGGGSPASVRVCMEINRSPRTTTSTKGVREVPLDSLYRTGKPSEQLEDYCRSRGWPVPIYVMKSRGSVTQCHIHVNKQEMKYNETYDNAEDAKQETAKKVLAALQMLNPDEVAVPAQRPEKVQQDSLVSRGSSFPVTRPSHPANASLVTNMEQLHISTPGELPVSTTEPKQSDRPTAISSKTASAMTQASETTAVATTPSLEETPTATSPTGGSYISEKSTLQELCHKLKLGMPVYHTYASTIGVGYIAEVTVDRRKFASTKQGSKKAAEELAARMAVEHFGSQQTMDTSDGNHVTSNTSGFGMSSGPPVSYKNVLQEYLQKNKLPLPKFKTEGNGESGFVSIVYVYMDNGKKLNEFQSTAQGTKRAAEQHAASVACHSLRLV